MRGGYPIRGGARRIRRGRGGVVPPPPPPPMATPQTQRPPMNGKLPFDLIFFEDVFPRVGPSQDDSALNADLLKRNSDITPSTEEMQGVQHLVTRVQGILENLILNPGDFDACHIEEIRLVGSFKQGIMLAGHKTADFVVILKTLPTREAVESLSNKVSEELRNTECVRGTVNERGFDLTNVTSCVRILITTIPPNFRKLDPDIHLSSKLINEHWQAIRHSRWFEENAHNSTVKVLIRILRDMRRRFVGFHALTPWKFDLLAHYATTNTPDRHALPINAAFRRSLKMIAAGMYLPGYAGSGVVNQSLTYEEQDIITATAQTLVRIMGAGGHRSVLGLERLSVGRDMLSQPTVWEKGVVVTPSEKVYQMADTCEYDTENLDEEGEEFDHTMDAEM